VYVLGIVDLYSRYVVSAIVKTTSWEHLKPVLESLFDRFGFPETLRSDNGAPFNGSEYAAYCEQNGIEKETSWPLNPRQNGAAEAIMKHIGKAARNAAAEGGSLFAALRARIKSHNSARHRETQEVPNEIMFSRRLREGLPMLHPSKVNIDEEKMRERDWAAKSSKKEYEDGRRCAGKSNIKEGDEVVVVRDGLKRKGVTLYDTKKYVVLEKDGSNLTMVDDDGAIKKRDVIMTKKVVPPMVEEADPALDSHQLPLANQLGQSLNDAPADENNTRGEQSPSNAPAEEDSTRDEQSLNNAPVEGNNTRPKRNIVPLSEQDRFKHYSLRQLMKQSKEVPVLCYGDS
jgi:hypothetical protein